MRWLWVVALIGATGCTKSNFQPKIIGPQPIPGDYMDTQCNLDVECDDGNLCTDDTCDLNHYCRNELRDCVDAADDCNKGVCDPMTGECGQTPTRDGAMCIVDFFTEGLCNNGICEAIPACENGLAFLTCTNPEDTALDDNKFGSTLFDSYKCPGVTGETGPEIGYDFTTGVDRTVTVFLTGATADLDLILLEGSICSSDSTCLKASTNRGTGNESITFEAKANVDYWFVVEGFGGAQSAYTIHVTCAGCSPLSTRLDCNMSIPGDTTGPQATRAFAAWDCATGVPGPEDSYTLVPAGDTDYQLTLKGLSQDLDMLVTYTSGGFCDPDLCKAGSSTTIKTGTTEETVSFNGLNGSTYSVIVDSKGTGGPYVLEVACIPSCEGRNSSFTCATGSDSTRNDDPKKSTNRVNDYGTCATNMTGREVIYHFIAPKDGVYAFELTGLTADLDLIVVEGTSTACDPVPASACFRYSNNPGTQDEQVTFDTVANKHYYIAVDGKAGAVSPYQLRMVSTQCNAWSCSASTSTLGCTWLEDNRRNDDPTRSKWKVDSWPQCLPNAGGSEVVYEFKAPTDGNFTVTLDQLEADLHLLVAPQDPGGQLLCNPAGTCTSNLRPAPTPSPTPSPAPIEPESVTIAATANKVYYVVVDGVAGVAGKYRIRITGDCPTGACKDGSDSLSCTRTSTERTNDSLGATNVISNWGSGGCASGTTGPEFVHRFTPRLSGMYTVKLSNQQADLDLIVLEASGATCEANGTCMIASQNGSTADETVTWMAEATKSYWLVVDGKAGAISPYKLQVTAGCN